MSELKRFEPPEWTEEDRRADKILSSEFPSFYYGHAAKFTELFSPPSDESILRQVLSNKSTVQQPACEKPRLSESYPIDDDDRVAAKTISTADIIHVVAKRRKRAADLPQELDRSQPEATPNAGSPTSKPNEPPLPAKTAALSSISEDGVDQLAPATTVSQINTSDATITEAVSNLSLVTQVDWEAWIVWDESPKATTASSTLSNPFVYINTEVDDDDCWSTKIIWHPEESSEARPALILDLNDNGMLFEDHITKPPKREHVLERPKLTGRRRIQDWRWEKLTRTEKERERLKAAGIRNPVSTGSNDPLNVSNDHWYQIRGATISTTQSLRKSLNVRTVEHSLPALRMVKPFFCTHLTEYEQRHFHRLPLEPDSTPDLIPVQSIQEQIKAFAHQREELRAQSGQVFSVKTRSDLSAKDGVLVLAEYCEEYPLLLMRPGMCTNILNYFKRSEDLEERAPAMPFGTVVYQGPKDPSPFLGNLDVGDLLQSFENNLFRAPAYFHKVNSTDFLLIRQSNQWFIREADAIFTLGQECPKEAVPAPSSKKAGLFQRDRLNWYISRLFRKSPSRQIRVSDVRDAFPTHSETHIRNRLKDCAEFKRGDTGAWTFNGDPSDLSEESLNDLLTPERVCAYESMLAGWRRLLDAGYLLGITSANGAAGLDGDDDQNNLEDEVKIAPWFTTADFINCIEGNGLLAVTGPADPTGRACEGFSYLRLPSKPGADDSKTGSKRQLPKRLPSRSLVGTEFDLRGLKKEEVKQKLMDEHGLSAESLKGVDRWQLVDVLRTLATKSAQDNEVENRYARTGKSALTESKEQFNADCQHRFKVQNQRLTSDEVLSSCEEDSESDDNDSEIDHVASAIDSGSTNDAIEKQKAQALEKKYMEMDAAPRPPLTDQSIVVSTGQPQADQSLSDTPNTRKLVITRQYKSGIRTEEVTDERVIRAYLRYQTAARASVTDRSQGDELADTEQQRRDNRLQKEKQRRLDRSAHREQTSDATSSTTARPRPNKGDQPSKCQSCGQLGHARGNKSCPRYVPRNPNPASRVRKMPKEPVDVPMSRQDGVRLEGTKFSIPRHIIEEKPLEIPKVRLGDRLRQLTTEGDDFALLERNDSPVMPSHTERARKEPKALLNGVVERLIKTIQKHTDAALFIAPVSREQCPDYDDFIQYPIDLQAMLAKAASNQYKSSNEFLRDVRQLVVNALLYNGPNSWIYNSAQRLRQYVLKEHHKVSEEIATLEGQIMETDPDELSLMDITETDIDLLEDLIAELPEDTQEKIRAKGSFSFR